MTTRRIEVDKKRKTREIIQEWQQDEAGAIWPFTFTALGNTTQLQKMVTSRSLSKTPPLQIFPRGIFPYAATSKFHTNCFGALTLFGFLFNRANFFTEHSKHLKK